MKPTSLALLASLALSTLATSTPAQNGPVPNITNVPVRRAYAPNNIVIEGTNLGLATEVRVNGVPTPIVRVRPFRIVAGPVSPVDPGFGTVEVLSGQSSDSAVVSFLPTLTAARRGSRVNVWLQNGEVGTFVLRYSYSGFGPAFDVGIYGPRWLGPASSALAAGVFTNGDPVSVPRLTLPIQIGQIGADLRLQAECYAATANVTAYTNLATVPGYGNPKN